MQTPNITPLQTPDITKAQVVSAATALLGAIIILFKLDLTDAQRAALVTIIGVVVPAAWQIADAIIRHGRSKAVAAGALPAPKANV